MNEAVQEYTATVFYIYISMPSNARVWYTDDEENRTIDVDKKAHTQRARESKHTRDEMRNEMESNEEEIDRK